MEKFVAIDSGKYATKVAEYNKAKKTVKKVSIRTAYCPGDFRDDAIEKSTVIMSASCFGDEVYKVGNGARGIGAELTTDKMLDVHRICAMTALTAVASSKEVDDITVAVLLPAKDWAEVSKREDFREYIVPTGEIKAKIKGTSASSVTEKTFNVKKVYVFPESQGALFMDETIGDVTTTSVIGVLDDGNLNLNATLWQGIDLVQDKSSTSELGGSILIQEIAQEISTHVTTCDEMVAAILLKEKALPSGMNITAEQEAEIFKIIDRVKYQHAERIKKVCHGRGWALDLIKIVAIGGTSKDLEPELKQIFGNNIIVLKNAEFVNVLGALRIMCSKELDTLIDISDVDKITA